MNQMPISKYFFPLIEHTTDLLPIQASSCLCKTTLPRGRFQTILGKINIIVTLTFDPPPLTSQEKDNNLNSHIISKSVQTSVQSKRQGPDPSPPNVMMTLIFPKIVWKCPPILKTGQLLITSLSTANVNL